MLMAMAVIGLTTYALLLTRPSLLTSVSLPSSQSNYTSPTCSEDTRQSIWSQLPDCRPRKTLVDVKLPLNPNILHVSDKSDLTHRETVM